MIIINQLKTFALLGVLTALLLWAGSFWGYSGLTFAFFFVLLMNIGSYFYSHKIVLAMYKAKKVSRKEAPVLHRLVEDVAKKAGIPKPKVCVIPSENPNAFATGRNPKNAVVAVTSGIIRVLDEDELKGVIAHEVGHIKNRDILVQTVASTIAGVIGYVAMMARWGAMFGGFGGRDERGSSMFELIALAIVTPLIAAILQLAISRSREFMADESAAKTLHDSKFLSSALQKIDVASRSMPMKLGNQNTASLFIVNPFKGGAFMRLFSTHPPMKERIRRLNNLNL